MSEKHDEKCLNPGARPLIINAEHDLRKLHKILQQVRDIFLLRHVFFHAVLDGIAEFASDIRFPLFLCTTTFEPFRDGVRRTKMRSRLLACLNGRPQEVAMSRRVQTRFMCIEKLLRCVLQTGVLRRHVSFERPLRQTRNHSDAVFVSANNRQRNCPNFGGHKS